MATTTNVNRASLTTNLETRYNNLKGKYDPRAVDFFQSVFAKEFTLFESTSTYDLTKQSVYVQGLNTTPYYPGANVNTK